MNFPMARIARAVALGLPHHVTQRGNRRQPTFFNDDDYQAYLELMARGCQTYQVEKWAYCLIPHHVHLIAIPRRKERLALAMSEAHKRYTHRINFREGWRGHLWQGRFASFVMDEPHLLTAMRYVELNPVKAGLAESPEAYRWSSARAHVDGQDDALVQVQPMLGFVGDWAAYLALDVDEAEVATMRLHERTGRPLGTRSFIDRLEQQLGRYLRRRKPGPKPMR